MQIETDKIEVSPVWFDPPREFSPAPFWFWNDALSEEEIVRQIDDFCDHGVYAFVIHPRVGLPRSIGWMSRAMLDFMRFAIEQAAKRDMWVILYDEGMYPSGSSSGQVVVENPAFRTRALFQIDLDKAEPGRIYSGIRIGSDEHPILVPDQNLVTIVKRKTNGHRIAVIDRAVSPGYSEIRGLHFLKDNPRRRLLHRRAHEDRPPAADILNPQAVACFIRLVYQRYYNEFKQHFGKTVRAIFTDEPSLLARHREPGAVPGTTGILDYVNAWLGCDFTPHLPALWYDDEPDAQLRRRQYRQALRSRLEETFYKPISQWCTGHGIALTGHPGAPDEIGYLRYFHIPGQDIAGRQIEPGKPSSLEGAQSTQAKAASSAMIHLGRRRNANECCGGRGHNFTFAEMKWLTNWLLVRGCNLLIPHAFFYSIRGPRIDERPPDVGPNSQWWPKFKTFADACRRLCWLNTDSRHICRVAILGLSDYLPWRAAKVCFQNQLDFNYLEARHLWEDGRVGPDGIDIAEMHYDALIVEVTPPRQAARSLEVLATAGRLIRYGEDTTDQQLLFQIDRLIDRDVVVSPPTPDLRVRHVAKDRTHYYMLFNESRKALEVTLKTSAAGRRLILDAQTAKATRIEAMDAIRLEPGELRVLMHG
jgi:hypothetical protein